MQMLPGSLSAVLLQPLGHYFFDEPGVDIDGDRQANPWPFAQLQVSKCYQEHARGHFNLYMSKPQLPFLGSPT